MSLTDASDNPSPQQSLTFNLAGARASASLSITPINDAPNGLNANLTVLEDAPHILSLTNFRASDVDGNNIVSIKVSKFTGNGTLKLNADSVSAGQFIPVTDIFAGKLIFEPAPDTSGSRYARIEFQPMDDGGTANGGVDLDETAATLTINVASVNDAPTGADATITVVEDMAQTLRAANFGFADKDGNALSGVRIASIPLSGALTLNGSAVTAGTIIPVSAINDGQLTFVPPVNGSGIGYASFTFQVQDNGGQANGGANLDPTPNTITFNVTPLDDAPVVTQQLADQTTDEDVAWTYQLPANTFTDADGDQLKLTASLVDGTSLPSWLTFNPNTQSFAGTPPPNYFGVIGLRVTASDASTSVSSSFHLTINPREDLKIAPGLDRADYPGTNGNIALGDFDRDGDLDLVSSNWNDGSNGTISLWRNEGSGAIIRTSTHSAPYAQDLQIADVTRDGAPDIIVEQTYANSIKVFQNDGSWEVFSKTYIAEAGNVVVAMELADLNGDGDNDLISTSYNQNQVWVSFGLGNGKFSNATTYPVGSIPYGLAVADVTGDGKLDLITADAGSNSISILAGGANGAFTPFATLLTGAAPLYVTVADLGNGHNDIIVNNRDSDTVTVFVGDGAGTFTATAYQVDDAPFGVATGDINGDGKLDVISANAGAGTVSVLIGNGDGSLRTARSYATIAGPSTVVAGDLNGDGRHDLAVGSATGMSLIFSTGFMGGLTLAPLSDSGIIGDKRTKFDQVTITGAIDPGSQVSLYDGASVVGTGIADSNGHFSIVTSLLSAGTRTLHAVASNGIGVASLPSALLTIVVDTEGPSAPSGLALEVASDSATIGDNVTNVVRPTIIGFAEAGSTIALLDGANPVGTGSANDNGSFAITVTAQLSDGIHSLTAKATDLVGNTGLASNPLGLTIDTLGGSAIFTDGDIDQTGSTKNVALSGTVNDVTTSVTSVRVYLDGALLEQVTPVNDTWAINEPNIADQVHLITLQTTDAAGNIGAGEHLWFGSSQSDTITGTNAAEIITGLEGGDRLTGGGGADWFHFGDSAFTPLPNAQNSPVDVITDFVQGEDKIHLAGMSEFEYGGQTFLVTPYHVSWFNSDGNTFVRGDENGDTAPDFFIALLGLYTLNSSDFIL